MSRTIILVAIGGLIGSVGRYLVAQLFSKLVSTSFPVGTFVVNIIGCLLIGFFYGLSERYQWFTPDLRILLTTGFCGGFTTFSTFAIENLNLLQSSQYLNFILYTAGSILFGIAAVFTGFITIKTLLP